MRHDTVENLPHAGITIPAGARAAYEWGGVVCTERLNQMHRSLISTNFSFYVTLLVS